MKSQKHGSPSIPSIDEERRGTLSLCMAIAKTACRNVAFKAAKMIESVFAGQSVILTREVATAGSSTDEEASEDLGL